MQIETQLDATSHPLGWLHKRESYNWVRMWRNQNRHALLVGMQNGAVIEENRVAGPENATTKLPLSSTLRYKPKRNKNI